MRAYVNMRRLELFALVVGSDNFFNATNHILAYMGNGLTTIAALHQVPA
jgi:hypothetical protein